MIFEQNAGGPRWPHIPRNLTHISACDYFPEWMYPSSPGKDNGLWVLPIYKRCLMPRLAPHQKLLVVPPTYGMRGNCTGKPSVWCTNQSYAQWVSLNLGNLSFYRDWAFNETRIEGFDSWPLSIHHASMKSADTDLGLLEMPEVLREYRALGSAIVAANDDTAVAPEQQAAGPQHNVDEVVQCGVVVAGGSAASLAAAIAAATAAPAVTVCLTDPTDWLGGQLTASAVSAIDFGANRAAAHWSRSFREMMDALGAPRNPGGCWVSTMCFEPAVLVERWINPTVAALHNLRVFKRTTVTATEPCPATAGSGPSAICALTAVQRSPRAGAPPEWGALLSQRVNDWYSPAPSPLFTKRTLRLEGKAFVEATEFGDVLATGAASALRLPVVQGIEEPEESSPTTDDQCGQGKIVILSRFAVLSVSVTLKASPFQPPR